MPTSPTAAEDAELARAVGRVRSRMRLRAALRALPVGLGLLGLCALAAVVAFRVGAHRGLAFGVVGAGFALAIAFVLYRARRVDPLDAARSADAALGLADRLTSAVSFLREPTRTPLMVLAIADGAATAARVDPRAVVSLSLPRSLWALVPLALLVAGAALVRRAPPPAHASVPPGPRFVVEQSALDAERATMRHLAAEAKGNHDPELQKLAEKLDALLRQIDEKKLTRSEAFAQLEAAQAQLKAEERAPPKPSEILKPAQQALASTRQTQKLAEDIAHDDLDAAQKELDRLAQEAQKKAEQDQAQKSEKDQAQEEMARALERASRAMDEAQKKADQERDKKIEELQQEERRLKQQQQQHPDDEENERRLKKNQRELERLEHEKQEQAEQRRQLQRLSRDLEKAAEQLRQKMSPEAMRQAAEQLRQMEDEIRKLGSNAQAQMQIAELKEVLRRAGRVEPGQGSPQDGQGKNRGKGKGSERDRQLAEFDKRAGGQPNALLLGGDDPGQGSVMLPLPGGDQGGDEQGNDPGGKGDHGDDPGDGIGDQHDPNLLGDKTHLKAEAKLIHASGQSGQGPTRSQTILDASERGFSTQSYQRAYKDYSAVVEEVMSQEGVPPGYRYYVKRYFQLIRPRE